jgi:protein phosphatase 2C zeta, putative (fragment)
VHLSRLFGTWFVLLYHVKLIVHFMFFSIFGQDEEIANDKMYYHMQGGCTALVALFVLGKLYVANAGDSR